MARTEPRSGGTGRALDVAVVALFVVLAARRWSVVEDAFISFRYARNLVDGYGLRFNPGENPPVEGFSNLLLVLVAAACEAAGVPPEHVIPAITLACGAVTLLVVLHTMRRDLGIGEAASRWALLALAVFPPFTTWATSGLETMPQTLLFFVTARGLAFAETPRAQAGAGLAALGLALLRTEGLLWAPVLVALAVLLRLAEGRPWTGAVGRFLAVLVPCAAVWLAWKVWYFGSLASNVAMVKVGFGPVTFLRGLKYVATFALVELWPVVALAAALLVGRPRARVVWAVTLAAGVIAWAAVVGGDYMPWFRFVVPATPWLATALAACLQAIASAAPRAVHVVGVIAAFLGWAPDRQLLLVGQATLRPLDYSTLVKEEGEVYFRRGMFVIPGGIRYLEAEARALARFTRPGQRVVTGAIGIFGYRNPRLILLDTCGLVSREIAQRQVEPSPERRPGHEKCVAPGYYADRNPDVLVFAGAYGDDPAAEVKANVARWGRKYPRQRYAPDVIAVPEKVPGGILVLHGLKRVPEGRDAAALWRNFDHRLAEALEGARSRLASAAP